MTINGNFSIGHEARCRGERRPTMSSTDESKLRLARHTLRVAGYDLADYAIRVMQMLATAPRVPMTRPFRPITRRPP